MSDISPNLVYLALLLAVLAGYFLTAFRRHPARSLQQLMVWALIVLGLVAVFGMWSDIRKSFVPQQSVMTGGRIEAPLGPDGHYYLTAEVNGVPVRFVVDTGASDIVLTRRDAERAGIDTAGLAFIGSANTANGTVATAQVRIETMDLGPIHDRNLRAVVNRADMDSSLMGMCYLTRFAKVEFDRDRLVLTR